MSKNSGTNCASSIGTEVKFAGNDSKSKMYEPKHKKKLVRVLTVIAYIFSVSLAAITLSLFYLFIYNPGKPGHGVASSNTSSGGRFYSRNQHEGVLSVNHTYQNYEREEPRALPLETVMDEQPRESHAKRSVSRGRVGSVSDAEDDDDDDNNNNNNTKDNDGRDDGGSSRRNQKTGATTTATTPRVTLPDDKSFLSRLARTLSLT